MQKPWSLRSIGPKSWEPSPKTSTPGPESQEQEPSSNWPKILEACFSDSWARARKCSICGSRTSFWPLLVPGPANAQIAPLGARFQGPGLENVQIASWGLILAIPGAMARKCSNCASGGSFRTTLGPGLENAQIVFLGIHFSHFSGQGQHTTTLACGAFELRLVEQPGASCEGHGYGRKIWRASRVASSACTGGGRSMREPGRHSERSATLCASRRRAAARPLVGCLLGSRREGAAGGGSARTMPQS